MKHTDILIRYARKTLLKVKAFLSLFIKKCPTLFSECKYKKEKKIKMAVYFKYIMALTFHETNDFNTTLMCLSIRTPFHLSEIEN